MSRGQRITEESGCTVLTTCRRVRGLSPTTGRPSINGQGSKPGGVLEETVSDWERLLSSGRSALGFFPPAAKQ